MNSDYYSRDGNNTFLSCQESEGIGVESFLKVGEWVQITNHSLNGHVGFVAEHDYWNSRYKVAITTNPIGRRAGGRVWIDEDKLISIDGDRHVEDIQTLIDFALDDKDETLFLELTSQRRYPANENC